MMVAIAVAVLIGIAAYNERGYLAGGSEVILQGICIAYAIEAIMKRGETVAESRRND